MERVNYLRDQPQNGAGFLASQANFLAETISFGAVGIKWKGYSVNAINGNTSYDISQPGNMKRMIGLAIFGLPTLPTTETISLVVNSDLAIDTVPALAICPQGPTGHVNNAMPFFPLFRELNGNDQIRFSVNGTASLALSLVIYYLP